MNIQLTDDSLRIEHRLPATAEKVFRYFTDTALAAKWMAPGDMQCVELEMDVVEGGSYRLTMADAAANSFTSTGTYSEVVPNKRLAYSWQWSHDDSPTTLVEIDFQDTDEGCLVVLKQRGFESAEDAISHTDGWGRIPKKLERLLATDA